MNKELFKKMEIGGVFAVFLAGTLLHFVYDWSNGSAAAVLFGAVNESVWEHVKIFTMPYAAWAVIELAAAMPPFKQFVVAKIAGLYTLGILTIVFFYVYTGIIGSSILWLDILSVFVWIAVSFWVSYKLTYCVKDLRFLFLLSVVMLLLFGAMYFSFTAAPPHLELFKDPVTGMYGVPV